MSKLDSLKIFILVVWLVIASGNVVAESGLGIYGYNALINAPTSYILKDGQAAFGVGLIPKPFAVLVRPHRDNYAYYGAIGILPFVEISMGFVRPENFKSRWGIGDRTASFKFLVYKEKTNIPAISIGLRDPFGEIAQDWAQHFTSSYVVFSKTLILNQFKFRAHAGYGTDWIKAANHQLVGKFGGIELVYKKFITLMFENDTEKFNAGIRVFLLNHISLTGCLMNLDTFSGGVNFYFNLL